jgi:hypothetical protein
VDELALKNKALVKARREMDEEGGPAPEPEARAIDMKIKSTEVDNATVQSHNELLKKIQDEKWDKYEWVDENVRIQCQTPESNFVYLRLTPSHAEHVLTDVPWIF